MKNFCTSGKDGFRSQTQAHNSIRNIDKKMRVYKCKECGKYHITSRLENLKFRKPKI